LTSGGKSPKPAADSEKTAAYFRAPGTHLQERMSRPPTGQRYQDIDELHIPRVTGGKLQSASGAQDNAAQMRQPRFNT
jgi:hypothetical protein